MARAEPQINLRIPPELKEVLEEAAVANKRSLTAEVVARLERSVSDQPAINGVSVKDLFKKLDEFQTYLEWGGKMPEASPPTRRFIQHSRSYAEEQALRDRASRLGREFMAVKAQVLSVERDLMKVESEIASASTSDPELVAGLRTQYNDLKALLDELKDQRKSMHREYMDAANESSRRTIWFDRWKDGRVEAQGGDAEVRYACDQLSVDCEVLHEGRRFPASAVQQVIAMLRQKPYLDLRFGPSMRSLGFDESGDIPRDPKP